MAASMPALEAIHAVLAAIAGVDEGRRGCFFVNSVTELAPHDAALAAFGQHHVTRTGALVGTSYGANLALAIALAAPKRVAALWLMGCDASAPAAGGPDLAGGLEGAPDATVDFLAGIVVRPADDAARAAFKATAHRVGAAQARFELMPQCGHLPTLEQPARAAALFRAFLGVNALHSANGQAG
jgi:pimeloyl-ACP methyl ester carboxylesterase